MDLDPARLGSLEAQQLLTGAVVPRPIAWVSTVSNEGRPNLAPFSYFAPVCSEPMTLLFCPVTGPPSRPKKDTLSNVEAVGEFVINVAEQSTIAAVNQSSAAVPHGRSEFELAGVTPVPAQRVRPPRVQEASIAFECRLRQIVRVDDPPAGGCIVIGTVVMVTIRDDMYDLASGRVKLDSLRPVARLGGTDYLRATDIFSMARAVAT